MIRSFLRFNTSNVKPNNITIFHDTNSKMSHHLLSKLTEYSKLPTTFQKYNAQGWFSRAHNKSVMLQAAGGSQSSKFTVELKFDQTPSYQDYFFIHEHCIGMHPGNGASFERKFPQLFELQNVTLCNENATRVKKQRNFIDDLAVLLHHEYASLAAEEKFFKAPLIIDWSNNLIADDDKGLDRIMANYLSCGIQDSHKNVLLEDNYVSPVASAPKQAVRSNNDNDHSGHQASFVLNTSGSRKKSTYNRNDIIHPHVAEFADLF